MIQINISKRKGAIDMTDKKYLDNAGLDHMWSKIKSYLGSNYSTKSELTSGLAGKANTGHTHTVSQITDFKSNSIKPLSFWLNLPSRLSVKEL